MFCYQVSNAHLHSGTGHGFFRTESLTTNSVVKITMIALKMPITVSTGFRGSFCPEERENLAFSRNAESMLPIAFFSLNSSPRIAL